MTIFYIKAEKDYEGNEYFNKYDLAKFIDGTSDTPAITKERVRKVVNTEVQ